MLSPFLILQLMHRASSPGINSSRCSGSSSGKLCQVSFCMRHIIDLVGVHI